MNNTFSDASKLMTTLSKKYKEFERSVEEKHRERDQMEKEMQTNIDNVRTEKSKIESTMKLKHDDSKKTRSEIDRISHEIMQVFLKNKFHHHPVVLSICKFSRLAPKRISWLISKWSIKKPVTVMKKL